MKKIVAGMCLFFLAASVGRSQSREQGVQKRQDASESAPPAPFDAYQFSGPFAHQNLAVFLIHQTGTPAGGGEDYLTLEEALRKGVVKVTEKGKGGQVNELEVANTGGKPVYLQAGDTVKGGKQDRTIAVDFVLPPKSGRQTVGAFCVEPGRWSGRAENGRGTVRAMAFCAVSSQVTSEQKLAVRLAKSQGKVWEAGKGVNRDLAAAGGAAAQVSDSFVLAAEDAGVRGKTDAYVGALKGVLKDKADAVGVAFAINGEAKGAEIYATPALFRKLWPKLLRTCATEALAKKKDKEEPKAATQESIRALFEEVAGEKGKVETRSGGIDVKVYDKSGVVLFDTEKDGRLLHRQIIKK